MRLNAQPVAQTFLLLGVLLLTACNLQSKGFVLPPGDVEAGKAAFSALGCTGCHSVVGEIDHSPVAEDGRLHVVLGGEVQRIATYGELVTSIVHPTHGLARPVRAPYVDDTGRSKMPDFNGTMTVEQLVNITAFLQGTYSITPPEYTPYHIPQR